VGTEQNTSVFRLQFKGAKFETRITMGGPKFWHDRAAEARRLSDRTLDPRSKFILKKIADEYDELARATGQTAARKPPQQERGKLHANARTRQ
jgi:hypothetical protein